jgi:hypothetical protein
MAMGAILALSTFQRLIRRPVAVEGKSLPDVGVVLEDSEMLAFPIIWLTLAVTVSLLAMKTRSRATERDRIDIEAKESGSGVAFLATIYGLALLAGFIYVSKFLISNL